jgi:hypothetical protein
MPKVIGCLDMLRAAGASGIVSVKVLREGGSILLVRPIWSTAMWREVDSDDPQHWISEAARVWHELQVEGSTFRFAEFGELDS